MPALRNDWRRTVALFALTGFVESLAFGHMGAFMPILLRELHVPASTVPQWLGILSSLGFVIGLPLLPFWGVWADRYGRKLIIIRSSVAGALMFALAGLSSNVWALAGARLMGGFVLGNTGVMMAVQESITPPRRLGAAVSVISAGAPIGMAVGPYLGGLVVESYGVRSLLLIDAVLTVLIALVLAVLLKEEDRPDAARLSTRQGVVLSLRAVTRTPAVAPVFVATFLFAFGSSMTHPYFPLLVQRAYTGSALASTIGLVLTISGLAMAIGTPVWGVTGDRMGHMRAWRLCCTLSAVALLAQVEVQTVSSLAVWRALQGVCMGGVGALTMVILARSAPPSVRSSVLALSLLPNQLSWFLGPLAASAVASAGIGPVYWLGSAMVMVGVAASWRVRSSTAPEGSE